jgi:hypothetical protein
MISPNVAQPKFNKLRDIPAPPSVRVRLSIENTPDNASTKRLWGRRQRLKLSYYRRDFTSSSMLHFGGERTNR